MLGDVCFEDVKQKSSYITPVPGGVGPMTIAYAFTEYFTVFKRRDFLKKLFNKNYLHLIRFGVVLQTLTNINLKTNNYGRYSKMVQFN